MTPDPGDNPLGRRIAETAHQLRHERPPPRPPQNDPPGDPPTKAKIFHRALQSAASGLSAGALILMALLDPPELAAIYWHLFVPWAITLPVWVHSTMHAVLEGAFEPQNITQPSGTSRAA